MDGRSIAGVRPARPAPGVGGIVPVLAGPPKKFLQDDPERDGDPAAEHGQGKTKGDGVDIQEGAATSRPGPLI